MPLTNPLAHHELHNLESSSTPPGETAGSPALPNGHACIVHSEQSLWVTFRAWTLPVAHILYSAILWYSIAVQLPGKTFAIGSGHDGKETPPNYWPQSDMTTLISALVLISRVLAGIWEVALVWRCIFLLLEWHSLTLSELQFLCTYQLPSLGASRADPRSAFVWSVAAILILAIPAQYSAPVITGSISWVPSHVYGHGQTSAPFLDIPRPGYPWSWYINYSNVRGFMVQEAAGFAILESLLLPVNASNTVDSCSNFSTFLAPPARRPMMQLQSLKAKTSIQNLTVPFLNITSFEWIDATELDLDMQDVITNNTGSLNITQNDNPLQITIPGVMAPLKTTQWDANILNRSQLPDPILLQGSKLVALQLKSGPTTKNHCLNITDKIFHSTPSTLLWHDYWNDRTACYAVANISVTAGTINCVSNGSTYHSSCSLSYSSAAAVYNIDPVDIDEVQPDPLVDQIFAMLPEVMALMVTTGGFSASHISQINASTTVCPELFVRNALTLGYQGTWSAFTERLANDTHTVMYNEPISVVVSVVDKTRVHIWGGIQLLLTLSSFLLWLLHKGSARPVVIDYIQSLLLLDSSRMVEKDGQGLLKGRFCLKNIDDREGCRHEILAVRDSWAGDEDHSPLM